MTTLRRIAVCAAAFLALTACVGDGGSSPMQLYPLEGPIARADATVVIEATAKNTRSTSGALSFRLPDKVRCEGTWTSLTPRVVSKTRGLSLTLKKTGGEIGRETETIGGVNSGEIYAVCDDGTRVQGTFDIGSGTTSGTGTATDTNGNLYKLLF